MIRVRFKTNLEDPRPVNWPIAHPYWISGETETHSIVVAYAENVEEVMANWPDAEDVDVMDEDARYVFTSRFPRPEWFAERVNA